MTILTVVNSTSTTAWCCNQRVQLNGSLLYTNSTLPQRAVGLSAGCSSVDSDERESTLVYGHTVSYCTKATNDFQKDDLQITYVSVLSRQQGFPENTFQSHRTACVDYVPVD